MRHQSFMDLRWTTTMTFFKVSATEFSALTRTRTGAGLPRFFFLFAQYKTQLLCFPFPLSPVERCFVAEVRMACS
jgi:hypothetical protein